MDELNQMFPLAEPENRSRLARIVEAAHTRLCEVEEGKLYGSLAISSPFRDGISTGKMTGRIETTSE